MEVPSGQALSCGQGQFPAFETSNWAHRTFLGGAFPHVTRNGAVVSVFFPKPTHHGKTFRADATRRRMRSGTTRAAERRAIIFP